MNEFHDNPKKKEYLINYEYFNNLNRNEDMTGMGMRMGWICIHPHPRPLIHLIHLSQNPTFSIV